MKKNRLLTMMAVAGVFLLLSAPAVAALEKVDVCHAAGRAGTTKFVTITVPATDSGYPQGHFTENGTYVAGHQDDYLGACVTDEPTTTTTSVVPDTTTTTVGVPEVTTTTVAPVEPPTTTLPTRTPKTVPERVSVTTVAVTATEPPGVNVTCTTLEVVGQGRFLYADNDANVVGGVTYAIDGTDGEGWAFITDDGTQEIQDGIFDCPAETVVDTPAPTELPFTGAADNLALAGLATLLIALGSALVRRTA